MDLADVLTKHCTIRTCVLTVTINMLSPRAVSQSYTLLNSALQRSSASLIYTVYDFKSGLYKIDIDLYRYAG